MKQPKSTRHGREFFFSFFEVWMGKEMISQEVVEEITKLCLH